MINHCSVEVKSDFDFLVDKLLIKENKLKVKEIEEVKHFEDNIETSEVIDNKVEEIKEEVNEDESLQNEDNSLKEQALSTAYYSIDELEFHGIIYWNDYKFTYYSESVLPGGGLFIEGRHTDNGFVKDLDGYIVLASSYNIPYGTIIETPFGALGKVYDRCPECHDLWFDVYTY